MMSLEYPKALSYDSMPSYPTSTMLRWQNDNRYSETALTSRTIKPRQAHDPLDACPEPLRGTSQLLSALAVRYRDASHRGAIAEFEAHLTAYVEQPNGKLALARWLKTWGPEWVTSRRSALAAVIECAAKASIVDSAELMDRVLKDEQAHPLVASVVAQRVRWLRIENVSLRESIGNSLLRWIRRWETSPTTIESSVVAIPSLPPLLHDGAAEPLEGWIRHGERHIAWGAANAVLDWCTNAHPMSDTSADALFDAMLQRLEVEGKVLSSATGYIDLIAVLLWSMGGVTTARNIERASHVFVQAFGNERGLEGAGAVRAGRTLTKRFKASWLRAIDQAFGQERREQFYRYTALLSS